MWWNRAEHFRFGKYRVILRFSQTDSNELLEHSKAEGSAIPGVKATPWRISTLGRGFLICLSEAETVLTETIGWTRVTAPYYGFDSVACERIALAPTRPSLNLSLLN